MKVIGLMSGTSADGVDAALCEITGAPPHLQAQIIHAVGGPYTQALHKRILSACVPQTSSSDTLARLNVDLAECFADAVSQLLSEAGVSPENVDLIGSHGQTVWHNVLPDGHVSATLQIVEASVIAERTGITTISNFRARDVAAGGQGAPLTAYVDWLLLRHPQRWRAVQNIGGIANVTFLPPLADEDSLPIAFDTGPGNVLINAAVHQFTEGKLTYDHDGEMAKRGTIDHDWLTALLQHPYLAQRVPKTTGRELFGVVLAAQYVGEGRVRGLPDESIVATLTQLTASSIADAYARFAPEPIHEVIVGGGGARNPVLMGSLRNILAPASVYTHEHIGINSDFKEALVFALLAYETWYGRPGSHPAFTGASHPSVLGQITPGYNYTDLIKKTWGRA